MSLADSQEMVEPFEGAVIRARARKPSKEMKEFNAFMESKTNECLEEKMEDLEDTLEPSKVFLIYMEAIGKQVFYT